MLEKMKAIEARLAEVERQLSDPTVYTDRERLTALSREQKELTPIAACARAYAQTAQTAEDACAMLSDPELRELAQEELSAAKAGNYPLYRTAFIYEFKSRNDTDCCKRRSFPCFRPFQAGPEPMRRRAFS